MYGKLYSTTVLIAQMFPFVLTKVRYTEEQLIKILLSSFLCSWHSIWRTSIPTCSSVVSTSLTVCLQGARRFVHGSSAGLP